LFFLIVFDRGQIVCGRERLKWRQQVKRLPEFPDERTDLPEPK
jgi:hypothetical protein